MAVWSDPEWTDAWKDLVAKHERRIRATVDQYVRTHNVPSDLQGRSDIPDPIPGTALAALVFDHAKPESGYSIRSISPAMVKGTIRDALEDLRKGDADFVRERDPKTGRQHVRRKTIVAEPETVLDIADHEQGRSKIADPTKRKPVSVDSRAVGNVDRYHWVGSLSLTERIVWWLATDEWALNKDTLSWRYFDRDELRALWQLGSSDRRRPLEDSFRTDPERTVASIIYDHILLSAFSDDPRDALYLREVAGEAARKALEMVQGWAA